MVETIDLFDAATSQALELRRLFLSRFFYEKFNGKVQHGLLKDFTLSLDQSWSPSDIAGKLFGLYEEEVIQLIEKLSKKKNIKTFINLGAADGYYAVGLVSKKIFENSICFEIAENGRDSIKKSAILNGVADKIVIQGEASENFAFQLQLMNIDLSQSLILCDVEGAEFNIFSSVCLELLKHSHIIIELHEFMVHNGNIFLEESRKNASKNFNITSFTMSNRNLSTIPALASLNDTDRWIICSEGRPQLMNWLHLAPKKP